MAPEKFRKPKVGEEIDYPCGCSYRIDKVVKGIPMEVSVSIWCSEHDPTILGNGEDEEDDIEWARRWTKLWKRCARQLRKR
jgi:hypothetical protein